MESLYLLTNKIFIHKVNCFCFLFYYLPIFFNMINKIFLLKKKNKYIGEKGKRTSKFIWVCFVEIIVVQIEHSKYYIFLFQTNFHQNFVIIVRVNMEVWHINLSNVSYLYLLDISFLWMTALIGIIQYFLLKLNNSQLIIVFH